MAIHHRPLLTECFKWKFGCLTPSSSGAQDSSKGVRNSSPKDAKTPIEKPLTKVEMLSEILVWYKKTKC